MLSGPDRLILFASRIFEGLTQERICVINPDGLLQIEGWAQKMRHVWEERFDALDRLLKEDMAKPVRLPLPISAQ